MDVHRKLDELAALVEGARAMPMSASCVVNRAEIMALLDDLRTHLPQQLAEAQHLVAERDAIVEEGRREAQRMIEHAKAERSRMLSATPDAREAVAEAERVRSRSLGQAEAMRAEVDEYVDSKLANFEVVLTRTMSAVQRGRERLRGAQTTDELRSDQGDAEPQEASANGSAPRAVAAPPADGFESQETPPTGSQPVYETGGGADRSAAYTAAAGYVTGEYPSVAYPSGEYTSGEYTTVDYRGGQYSSSGEYPSGDYPTGDYPSGGYAAVDHPSGGYAPAGPGNGEFVAAGYPNAADYPGSAEYTQPAHYSASTYPGADPDPADGARSPALFADADEQSRYLTFTPSSGNPGQGDR